jgi:hypothetical protein
MVIITREKRTVFQNVDNIFVSLGSANFRNRLDLIFDIVLRRLSEGTE